MALSDEYVKDTCKIGQGHDCCRYLAADANGFRCEKLGPLKGVIDSRVTYMIAQADNCKGVKHEEEV